MIIKHNRIHSDKMAESDSSVEVKKRKLIPVNNVAGLESKLNEIQLNLDWVEKLDILVDSPDLDIKSEDKSINTQAENDFKREMIFYNQALACVQKGFSRLKKLNIPTKRPDDFFAEMAKSDAHMKKVREKLLSKQMEVERRDKVRSIRETKKQGKKIQQEVLKQRRDEKQKMINALKKTKKGKMGADQLLGEKKTTDRPSKSKRKREFKNEKYGYGGKKRGSKWNTAESSADIFGERSRVAKNGSKKSFGQKASFNKGKRGPKNHRRRR